MYTGKTLSLHRDFASVRCLLRRLAFASVEDRQVDVGRGHRRLSGQLDGLVAVHAQHAGAVDVGAEFQQACHEVRDESSDGVRE